jgi:hypothetical protein
MRAQAPSHVAGANPTLVSSDLLVTLGFGGEYHSWSVGLESKRHR